MNTCEIETMWTTPEGHHVRWQCDWPAETTVKVNSDECFACAKCAAPFKTGVPA